jgi:O-methyltransferase
MTNKFITTARQIYWKLASKTINKSNREFPPDTSDFEKMIINRVRPFTLTTPERISALIGAVHYICSNNISGDIVECGVWKGGSMMAAALTCRGLGKTEYILHLFDTFDGMSPPTEADKDFLGNSAAGQMAIQDKTSIIWARAQLDEVQNNMESTGYPVENIRYIKGLVEDTIPNNAPESIALLRLDTDWYESTKHEMEHLFHRLVPGGVLILDDYGHWEGARKAVDEYIANHKTKILLCRIDMGGRIAIKQT